MFHLILFHLYRLTRGTGEYVQPWCFSSYAISGIRVAKYANAADPVTTTAIACYALCQVGLLVDLEDMILRYYLILLARALGSINIFTLISCPDVSAPSSIPPQGDQRLHHLCLALRPQQQVMPAGRRVRG